jgi:hypothetical protein
MSGIYTPTVIYVLFGIVTAVIDGASNPLLIGFLGFKLFFLLLTALLINYLCSIGLSLFVWIFLIYSIGMYVMNKISEPKSEPESELEKPKKQKKKNTVKFHKNK